MVIGELARKVGVSRDTIRFYESKGLLHSERNRENNYRIYTEESIRSLRFIQRLKNLGFTLSEIRELIRIVEDTDVRCGSVREIFEAHLASIEKKIRDLIDIRSRMQRAIRHCRENPAAQTCGILKDLWLDS